jgi:hypothetical protein
MYQNILIHLKPRCFGGLLLPASVPRAIVSKNPLLLPASVPRAIVSKNPLLLPASV